MGSATRRRPAAARRLTDLVPDPQNRRAHNPRNISIVVDALTTVGAARSIVIDEDNVVLAGNGVVEAAAAAGITKVRVIEADGREVIAVRLSGLTDEQKRALAIYDNRAGELATWDVDQLLKDQAAGLELKPFFTDADLSDLFGTKRPKAGRTDPDVVPDVRRTGIKLGDLFELGPHRLLCGDSTSAVDMQRVLNGVVPSVCATDPPYCSGGFQEAGRASGSVGTDAVHKQIANDRLSTRGYQALLKQAFSNTGASFLYAFTDWRMWVWLFDIAESCGYGVRSMIVWDKGTPGMGRGWRAQHELVLWATKETPPFDKHASGVGNVISERRTGNVNHTTEKPASLMVTLLQNIPFAETVVDPFAGSGTTLIACQQLDQPCFAIELDAGYCQVIIDRWEAFTGQKAQKVG